MKTPNSKSLRLLLAFSPALCLVAPRTVADEPRFFRIVGPTAAAITTATPDGYITWTNAQVGTNYTIQTARRLGAATNWVDYVQIPVTSNVVTNRLYDPNPPSGMALIPAGSFTIGDTLDGHSDAIPASVYLSGFYMDVNLVCYSQWQTGCSWATNHGYSFTSAGAAKAANHPVEMVDWYDAVKWANARSKQAGLTPVYYADAGFTQVYTNGETANVFPNWTANGYRLPTEAEWEKAARGGLSDQRFAWGLTISWSEANYYGYPLAFDGYAYDFATAVGHDPAFNDGIIPYTAPVGSFAANGYELKDMGGTVFEWCWDFFIAFPPYPPGSPYLGGTDPRGPASSPFVDRVLRGGSWDTSASYVRCAFRYYDYPSHASNRNGFRCAKGF